MKTTLTKTWFIVMLFLATIQSVIFSASMEKEGWRIVDSRDGSECDATPLVAAVMDNDHQKIKSLLDNKAAIDADNGCGFTPLMAAISNNGYSTARLLLESNANADGATKDGTTPLYYTVDLDNNGTIFGKLLIEYGADVNRNSTVYFDATRFTDVNMDPDAYASPHKLSIIACTKERPTLYDEKLRLQIKSQKCVAVIPSKINSLNPDKLAVPTKDMQEKSYSPITKWFQL